MCELKKSIHAAENIMIENNHPLIDTRVITPDRFQPGKSQISQTSPYCYTIHYTLPSWSLHKPYTKRSNALSSTGSDPYDERKGVKMKQKKEEKKKIL